MTRVFVVDDDPSVLKATTRLLRASGFEAMPFASPLQYLQQFDPADPGCLVVDLNMPGVSGLQLRQALVERGGAPAIVFLTGQAEMPRGAEAMNAGPVAFLTKPVDGQALVKAVQDVLAQAVSRMDPAS